MAIMTSRQAADLDIAFEEHGWTTEMVKQFYEGDALTLHRKIFCGELVVQKASLLKLMSTIIIPPTQVEEFIAKDHFVIDADESTLVEIYCLGKEFEKWFIPKIEQPIGEKILQYQELGKRSTDRDIIADFGSEKKAEITLQELFILLQMQCRGEMEYLSINHRDANLFYIRDNKDVLRRVSCSWWSKEGWSVHADSIDSNVMWDDNSRVFSRRFP